MCLSTPTTAGGGNTTSGTAGATTACSAGPCSGAVAACSGVAGVTKATAADCCQNSCDTSCSKANNNSSSNNNNNNSSSVSSNHNSITHRKVASSIPQESLDLVDNLGYNEENANAVYKEICRNKVDAMVGATNNNNNNNTTSSNTGSTIDKPVEYNPQIRWPDLIAQSFLHCGALYGVFLLFSVKFYTFAWFVLTIWISGIGITAGAHRLWSHKSYSASLPLRCLLIFLFTIAGQRDAYTWALDHRIHHKFSETDADPHNAKRGFFFAHVGWLFLTPHPEVVAKREVIDMSDLENDPVVAFQRKWYLPMFALISIGMTVLVPWYFWNENLWISFWVNFNLRFCCTLNVAFFVNSVAHMWGRKPYDKTISPVESPIVSFLALGEGWHNYHHVFPWDYKTGEFGNYRLNMTTAFIDFCAKLGLAKGRKSVSPDMVKRRAAKCGDGTRFLTDDYAHKDQVWGYGDQDISKEDLADLAKMHE